MQSQTPSLYQAAHYSMLDIQTVPVIPSKTSLPQEWHKPRTAGVSPECLQDIQIRKPELKPEKGKKRSIDGVQCSLYNPIGTNFPPKKFIKDFQKEMTTVFPGTQFSKLFETDTATDTTDTTDTTADTTDMTDTDTDTADTTDTAVTECKFGLVPKGSVLSYQQTLAPDYSYIRNIPQSEEFPKLPTTICLQNYSAALQRKESLYFEGLQISLQESHEIEEQTRDQSKSPYWIKLRKSRLTASKFKRVAARKKDLESLVGQLKRTVKQTEAMKYGLAHEGEAAMIYADSKAANVKRTGFVINPGCPYLGASPDYIVFDPTSVDAFGLLEIKCLQCSSTVETKCLKIFNGQLKLRKTHEYYYQIEGQLGVTGLKWCDLMVLCKDDWHIERIPFDKDFFNSMCYNLDIFYFEYYLPSLVL